ncbi:MAG: hypothetical protein R3B07_24700 [Polyangiaceae bacterium]
MPDFDVDFCMAKRDRVIRYVWPRSTASRASGRSRRSRT